MNTYHATLHDRYIDGDGSCIIRGIMPRSGEPVDIIVPDNMTDHASAVWGGNLVEYTLLDDDTAVFAGEENIPSDFEYQVWVRHARAIAPEATDAELSEIYEAPMSHSDRVRAIEALRAGRNE